MYVVYIVKCITGRAGQGRAAEGFGGNRRARLERWRGETDRPKRQNVDVDVDVRVACALVVVLLPLPSCSFRPAEGGAFQ